MIFIQPPAARLQSLPTSTDKEESLVSTVFALSMATLRVSVAELQIGMYVARLNVSWLRSPFLRHSFLIEHPSQIEKLVRAGVTTVEIDLDRGIGPQSLRPSDVPPADTTVPQEHMGLRTKSLDQLNKEYAQAKSAKQQLDHAVQSVFSTIKETGTVNPQQAAEAVQEITIVMRTLSNSAIFMALSQNRSGDSTLSRHALTVCTLSLVLGQTFQFNPLELQELATAALLHDIGLLQLSPTLLRQAHVPTALPMSVQQQFQTHPRLAALSLQRQGGIEPETLHLIAHHHAYLDESGYPKETRGQSTSDRARILMVIDRYDELTTGFGGLPPLTPQQTFQHLYKEARQGKLDQRFVSSFIAIVGIYPVHSYVRLNTRELAVVTELNQATLHQPIITITHQPGGEIYPTPFLVDLAHQERETQPRVIETVLNDPPPSLLSAPSHAA